MKLVQSVLHSKFFKDFAVIFSFDMIAKVFTIAIMLLLVRLMEKTDYALFVKFNSIANLMFGIFASGIGIAFVRSVSELSSSGKNTVAQKLYFLTLIGALVVLLPIFFLSPVLSNLYRMTTFLFILSLLYALIISTVKISQFYYQGQEKYQMGGWIDVIRTFGILLPILIIWGISKKITISQTCLIYILSGGILFLFIFGMIFRKTSLTLDSETITNGKSLLKECGWLFIYRFILELFCQMDVFMLSRYATDADIANYGVAQKYQALSLSVLPALLALMRIKTAQKFFSEDPLHRKEFTLKWLRLTAPVIFLITAAGIFLSRYILPFLNGPKYDNSVLLFQIMLIGVGISYIFSPNTPMLMSAKRFPTLCLLCSGSLLIAIVGNYFLIPRIGAVSPAIFFVLSHAFLNVGSTLCVLHDGKITQTPGDQRALS